VGGGKMKRELLRGVLTVSLVVTLGVGLSWSAAGGLWAFWEVITSFSNNPHHNDLFWSKAFGSIASSPLELIMKGVGFLVLFWLLVWSSRRKRFALVEDT